MKTFITALTRPLARTQTRFAPIPMRMFAAGNNNSNAGGPIFTGPSPPGTGAPKSPQ